MTTKVKLAAVLALMVVAAALYGVLVVAPKARYCQELEATRVSYLLEGHDTSGLFNVYVRGVGTERSQVSQYEAVVDEMAREGCG